MNIFCSRCSRLIIGTMCVCLSAASVIIPGKGLDMPVHAATSIMPSFSVSSSSAVAVSYKTDTFLSVNQYTGDLIKKLTTASVINTDEEDNISSLKSDT